MKTGDHIGGLRRDQLEAAFKGTHFGPEGETDEGRAGLVERGVLEIIAGYRTGSTLYGILKQLRLITDKGNVTLYGKKVAFYGYERLRLKAIK